MTQTLNRFFHLIFPVLTAIGLAVSYLIWWVYDELMRSVYGTVPLLVIAFAVGIFIVSPGLVGRRHRTIYRVLLASYVAALVINISFDWTPTRAFYRFYSGIHSGMTIAEVQQQLDQTYPPNGRYSKPLSTEGKPLANQDSTLYFRLEPKSAEIVTVYFSQGRVTRSNYSPD
jgi:hypothetical protein